MGEGKSEKQEGKGERKFSREQYEMLLRCSQKKDMTEWNEWRKHHPDEPILLERASLAGATLENAHMDMAHLEAANLSEANLRRARLAQGHLAGVRASRSDLRGAQLSGADLRGAQLGVANLEGADLVAADLQSASLWRANLEGAAMQRARLSGAYLGQCSLRRALLAYADLRGAELTDADLSSARLTAALVDGATLFWGSTIDRNTDVRSVGLASARIEPATRQLLEYNIRRINWERWYTTHPFWRWPVRAFWWMSDYGRLTGRIVGVFFGLAIFFAIIYYIWGIADHPGIVGNLFVDRDGVQVPGWLAPIRAVYFSIVTMTTLGFGDMYAYAKSFWGHILLTVQVLLGYVLLAALVTRFAILFQAGGPAGKFEKGEKKKKQDEQDEQG